MSLNSGDLCLVCSKNVKNGLENIRCKICNGFVHKKMIKVGTKATKKLESQ